MLNARASAYFALPSSPAPRDRFQDRERAREGEGGRGQRKIKTLETKRTIRLSFGNREAVAVCSSTAGVAAVAAAAGKFPPTFGKIPPRKTGGKNVVVFSGSEHSSKTQLHKCCVGCRSVEFCTPIGPSSKPLRGSKVTLEPWLL